MGRGLGKLQGAILKELFKEGGTMGRELLYFAMQRVHYGNAILTAYDLEFNAIDMEGHKCKIEYGRYELNKRRAAISQALISLKKRELIKRQKILNTVTLTDKGEEITAGYIIARS